MYMQLPGKLPSGADNDVANQLVKLVSQHHPNLSDNYSPNGQKDLQMQATYFTVQTYQNGAAIGPATPFNIIDPPNWDQFNPQYPNPGHIAPDLTSPALFFDSESGNQIGVTVYFQKFTNN